MSGHFCVTRQDSLTFAGTISRDRAGQQDVADFVIENEGGDLFLGPVQQGKLKKMESLLDRTGWICLDDELASLITT
jgi:hypothetical protein